MLGNRPKQQPWPSDRASAFEPPDLSFADGAISGLRGDSPAKPISRPLGPRRIGSRTRNSPHQNALLGI